MQKSDPFGGAPPIDPSKAAKVRQQKVEEKVGALDKSMVHTSQLRFLQAQQEAERLAEAKPVHEMLAKQQSDKEASRQVIPRSYLSIIESLPAHVCPLFAGISEDPFFFPPAHNLVPFPFRISHQLALELP